MLICPHSFGSIFQSLIGWFTEKKETFKKDGSQELKSHKKLGIGLQIKPGV